MRIISRLFLASYLRLFFLVLFGSLLTIIVIEILLKFDEIVESATAAGIVRYFLLRIPSGYLRDTIPVASFTAAFLGIGGPARAREILALKAGGISPRRVIAPIVLASLLLSVAAFAVNETLVLSAERGESELSRPDFGISFRRGSFWYHKGNVVYNIHDADRASRTLHGVSVYRLNARGQLVESIRAPRVVVEDAAWILTDALRQTFDPSRPDAPPRTERISEKVLDLGGAKDLAQLGAGIERLSIIELREYIEVQETDGRNAVDARARLQRRLADPLTVALFAWIALPLGFGVERTKSLAVSAVVGIVWVSIFYTLRLSASALASAGVALAAFAPWLLLAAFGGFAAWRLARTAA